jgi:BirA family biotin operon repressor/biotin-[acetyl-CoA-carboxylase] ligase
MQTLKFLGLPIETEGRSGYRITTPVDNSLAVFHGTAWTRPHYFLNSVSTQVAAKAGAEAGLPEGHLWIAETQTKGRGRLGRVWESSYGGLWFSLVLRPKIAPARLPPLSLVCGLSLREAIKRVCGVTARLKWPNDLLVGNGRPKKLAGILTEMSGQLDRTEWVVLGVGLNVNNVLSSTLQPQATSLRELTGKIWPRAKILEAFVTIFRTAYRRYVKEGFAPFRAAYWSHYFAPNRILHLKTGGGTIAGYARGIDADGAIMIESRRKIRAFTEGEIV